MLFFQAKVIICYVFVFYKELQMFKGLQSIIILFANVGAKKSSLGGNDNRSIT